MARSGTPLSAADIRNIRRLRSQGASVRGIAAAMNVSTTTVQKYLAKPVQESLQNDTLVS